MTIFLSNKIAKNYDVGSIIYKKDYKRGIIIFMKVTSMSFYGFKNKNTHTKFSGHIIDKKPLYSLKKQNNMKTYTEEDLKRAFKAGFFTFYFEVCTSEWNKEKDFKEAWKEYQQELNKTTLVDLIGEHLFSGIDIEEEEYEGQLCEVIKFILDNKTYKVIENPSDGYRSYLRDIEITKEKISNTFSPQKVIIKEKKNEGYQINNTIQFFDAINKKLILEIGTDNADDWYPYCVMEYHPENMEINKDK